MASSSALAADEASHSTNLFDDVFEVLQVNPEGKKFEKGEVCGELGWVRTIHEARAASKRIR